MCNPLVCTEHNLNTPSPHCPAWRVCTLHTHRCAVPRCALPDPHPNLSRTRITLTCVQCHPQCGCCLNGSPACSHIKGAPRCFRCCWRADPHQGAARINRRPQLQQYQQHSTAHRPQRATYRKTATHQSHQLESIESPRPLRSRTRACLHATATEKGTDSTARQRHAYVGSEMHPHSAHSLQQHTCNHTCQSVRVLGLRVSCTAGSASSAPSQDFAQHNQPQPYPARSQHSKDHPGMAATNKPPPPLRGSLPHAR